MTTKNTIKTPKIRNKPTSNQKSLNDVVKTKKESKKGSVHSQSINVMQNKRPTLLKINPMSVNKALLKHKDLLQYSKEFSPKSGSELKYNPKLWNDKNSIRTTHNCYTYALGKIRSRLESKAQPGYASGFKHIDDDKDYNCESFYERLKKDVPGSYIEVFDKACIPGFYKIFLALDPGNDYHWWRMNSDGYWSHKPGSTEVTDIDASGKKIKNPLIANRSYTNLNYHKPCFFACVYSDLSKSVSYVYNEKIY